MSEFIGDVAGDGVGFADGLNNPSSGSTDIGGASVSTLFGAGGLAKSGVSGARGGSVLIGGGLNSESSGSADGWLAGSAGVIG